MDEAQFWAYHTLHTTHGWVIDFHCLIFLSYEFLIMFVYEHTHTYSHTNEYIRAICTHIPSYDKSVFYTIIRAIALSRWSRWTLIHRQIVWQKTQDRIYCVCDLYLCIIFYEHSCVRIAQMYLFVCTFYMYIWTSICICYIYTYIMYYNVYS